MGELINTDAIQLFEDKKILKIGYKQKKDYILLKQIGIIPQNLMFDIEIAGYLLNSNINKYSIEYLASEYLNLDMYYIETSFYYHQLLILRCFLYQNYSAY